MASKWNTGKLVSIVAPTASPAMAAANAIEGEGVAFFQSVVNSAANAMASGAEAVADAAETAYELLPEADTLKESVSSKVAKIPESNVSAPSFSMPSLSDFGTSEFRFFFSNFFQTGSTLTEEDFNETDIRTLTDVVKRAKSEGLTSVDYDYFGTSEGDVLKGGVFAGLFDPKLRMARTTGGFTFYENEKGETIISNTYNFNSGPKRRAFYEAKKKGDNEAALKVLSQAATNPVELASILAYAKQEELREEGKPFESELKINLGVL